MRPESHIIRLSGRSLLRAPQRPVRGQLSARPSSQSYFLEKINMSSHGASWRRPPRATPIPQHRWPSPRLGRLVPGVDGHLLWKLCQTTATPGAFCHGAGGREAQIRSEEGSAGGLVRSGWCTCPRKGLGKLSQAPSTCNDILFSHRFMEKAGGNQGCLYISEICVPSLRGGTSLRSCHC